MVTGNVSCFLRGYLVVGPDWHLMLLSCFFIIFGSLAFVCINILTEACIVVACLALASLMLLLCCALFNPGILAKRRRPSEVTPPQGSIWIETEYFKSDGTRAVAKLEQKWCYSCNLYRPLRAVHCRFCDICILRRDHHCPWTGICIGAGNYTAYFILLWLVLALTLVAFIGGIASLVKRISFYTVENRGEDIWGSLNKALLDTYCLELLLILITLIWVVLTTILASKHTYLVSKNMTSSDYLRPHNENFFQQGSFLANARQSLCYFNEAWIQSKRTLSDAETECDITIMESV